MTADGLGEVVVMTASVAAPAGGVRVARAGDRLLDYTCAALRWLGTPGVRGLVFCEGSGWPACGPPFDGLRDEARRLGVALELLGVDVSGEVRRFGKGRAEVLLLAHAARGSALLGAGASPRDGSPSSAGASFYKVTGRLWVRNFAALAAAHRPDAAAAAAPPVGHGWAADTRFFKCSPGLLRGLLGLLPSLDDARPGGAGYLENAGAAVFASAAVRFREPPVYVGRSATTGRPYDGEFEEQTKRRAWQLLRPRRVAARVRFAPPGTCFR